jgi:hypothetical protein
VSFHAENPIDQLGLRAPGALGSGKRLSNSRWPGHGGDARKRRRACVSLRSILRVGNHTKVGQGR